MLFSEKFGITPGPDDNWFDPILHVDTRLFIDPFLIYADEKGPFEGSHAEVLAFFEAMFLRIATSNGETASPPYASAVADLTFPEVPEFCLGYTGAGTGGAGAGGELAKGTAAAIWDATRRGRHNLSHFELVAILRENIGRDRISDTTAWILRHRFITYTQAVCDKHGVTDLQEFRYPRGRFDRALGQWVKLIVRLPKNPFNGKAVLLAPRDYLRELPTLNSGDFWDYCVANEDQILRDRLNYDISKQMPKKEIVALAWANLEAVDRYTTKRESDGSRPYDYARDTQGIVSWYEPTKAFAAANPLNCPVATSDDLKRLLGLIVDAFADFVEGDDWKLMWSGNVPRKEEAAQLLFLGIASSYCVANDVTVTKVEDLGKKPFELKTPAGVRLKAIVEVKLVKNGRFRNVFVASPPRYKAVEENDSCHVLLVQLNDKDEEKIREVRAAASKFDDDARPAIKFLDVSWSTHAGTSASGSVTINAGDNARIHLGDDMGDTFNISAPVTGSAIGRDATVWARDITSFRETVEQSSLESPLKKALNDARAAIEEAKLSDAERGDAIDDLAKLKEELERAEKDKGRLRKFWERVKGAVPAAGEFLGSFVRGYVGEGGAA